MSRIHPFECSSKQRDNYTSRTLEGTSFIRKLFDLYPLVTLKGIFSKKCIS
ncbi:hypothetical protein GCM10009567_05630 [Rothia amarae]